jgi:signal transduction histidine kinase
MRTTAPYEVNPRQLRALVLLLALLPLMPAAFVFRFLIEEIHAERLEARTHAGEVYQKFLNATRAPLAASAWRQINPAPGGANIDPWKIFAACEVADTVLGVGPHGVLAPPPRFGAGAVSPTRQAGAVQLAGNLLESGLTRVSIASAARTRWRFFAENPEPLFAVALPSAEGGTPAPTVLLVASRQHLLDEIAGYYDKLLDPRSVLRVIDENGEATLLLARDAASQPVGEELAHMALPPPLPTWRVQLFGADASLVDGMIHEQINYYAWMLGSMLLLTGVIAAVAGWTLSRRIALNELSNDALTTVAHEMKTPLSSTRMLLDTLLQGRYHGGEAQVREYLELMAGENQRLERLVGSFQLLAHLERSHGPGSELRRAPVSASEIISAACAQLAPRWLESGSTVRVEVSEPPPVLYADQAALTAALVNLLDNAAKYSNPGQEITVRASDGPGGAWLEVADQGIGIPAAEQERIFERFYQSDRRLARTYEGCGLGLSIVQSVVRLHGGTITVKSTPGRGSTFTMRLPPAPSLETGCVAGERRRGPWQWLRRRRGTA